MPAGGTLKTSLIKISISLFNSKVPDVRVLFRIGLFSKASITELQYISTAVMAIEMRKIFSTDWLKIFGAMLSFKSISSKTSASRIPEDGSWASPGNSIFEHGGRNGQMRMELACRAALL